MLMPHKLFLEGFFLRFFLRPSFAYVWNLDEPVIPYHVRSWGKVWSKSSNHRGQRQKQEGKNQAHKGFYNEENDDKSWWSEANHPSMMTKRKTSRVLTSNKLYSTNFFSLSTSINHLARQCTILNQCSPIVHFQNKLDYKIFKMIGSYTGVAYRCTYAG